MLIAGYDVSTWIAFNCGVDGLLITTINHVKISVSQHTNFH